MATSWIEERPVRAFKDEVMGCDAPYLIIEAETGSGKSTEVPRWYRALGLKVLVTEPLIETVIGTSEYVAELEGCRFGEAVGYRTGEYRCDSPNTEVLFCTDALALVRELAGHNRFEVLVIDELHEWNTNQSTLEAWAWKHLQDGDSPFKKIVVLSATLDSDELSRKRGNAPIFKVPGRQYQIVDRPKGMSIESDVRALVAEGHDVMVFQPGEREIMEVISSLAGLDAELIPFYGKLEREAKNRAYGRYSRPKVVVCTNSLETGRTMPPSAPDREVWVVDSGMERRIELVDGIEGLYLKPIAKARSKQRRGRAGRLSDGGYIDHCPTENRPEFPVPEILRTRLDQTVLRLACVGYDATELPFFHDLDKETIVDAKRALHALGAMLEDGSVTKTGRQMARLPISVQYARMVIEADRLGEEEDVTTIVALLEAGGLRAKDGHWQSLTAEKESDLLAELDLFEACQSFSGEDFRENGIFARAYFRAKEIRAKLRQALLSAGIRFDRSEKHDRQAILKSCVAGMVDHLYHGGYGEYRNGSGGTRQKARESVVSGSPEWVVGLPKDIGFKDRRGYDRVLNLVSMVSAVDPMWLAEVAPQLVRLETGLSPRFDSEKDLVVSTTQVFFKETKIKDEMIDDPAHAEAASVLVNWLASQCL